MRRRHNSDTTHLLTFFACLILAGSALLYLPESWAGSKSGGQALSYVDALFISTSAVCVTGLVTVDTSEFSRFGQTIILLLIQLGGLGIISFSSLALLMPGHRIPFRRLKTIRGFSVGGVEHDPVKIVRNIVGLTLAIEAAGTLVLTILFAAQGQGEPLWEALFHAVSAFCNAGFSLFPTSLENFSGNPLVLLTISALIITGGIGFIVLQDLERRIRGKRRRLSYHSKLVLFATTSLIVGGALAFFLLERQRAYAGMSTLDAAINAFFQAVTPRTAGFDAVMQSDLSRASKFVTTLLMFIGGAPGSIAGGIKVSTAFLVAAVMFRRPDENGDITVLKRRLPAATTHRALVYFLKATAILALAAGALSLTEGANGAAFDEVVFEAVSAFATVGLSLGITSDLSVPGKVIIIATMFAGRVGLIALAFPGASAGERRLAYPEGDVLLG